MDEIVNKNLTYAQHYEIAESLEMPELIFCLDLDSSLINTSQKLTGNYLQDLTGDISAENIFEKIQYLGDKNKWNHLGSGSSSGYFEMDTFFFLFKKWLASNRTMTNLLLKLI